MEGKTPAEAAEAARLAAMTPEQQQRAAYTDGLRKLADLLDAGDDLELPYTGRAGEMLIIPLGEENQRAQLIAWGRALARHGKLDRRTAEHEDGSSSFYLSGNVGGVRIQIIADRDTVCRRVVIGTEPREVEEVIRPAEVRTVTRDVEIIEWDCSPVTAAAAEGAAETSAAA